MLAKYFLLCLVILASHCDQLPLVQSPLGTVRGYVKTSHDGRKFSAFEGIPYAKPPIGNRRFEESEPIDPWHGTWNASLLTECAQTSFIDPDTILGDEDCLHINVYVPRDTPNPSESIDVIVHIHGGAFMHGSGNMFTHPHLLMDREIIFVTFNYRLGIFGFLSTEDEVVPGNNGLKDQVLALKWVQTNIASFGGNPNSVTLTGLSAGGGSVHFHYFSSGSKGLYHRGFSESGVALIPSFIRKAASSHAKKLGDYLGCSSDSSRILVDCLKSKPFRHVLEKVPLFLPFRNVAAIPFGPVIEREGFNPFLIDHPYSLLAKGQVNDVPWIASTTTHEGLLIAFPFFSNIETVEENWEEYAPILLDFNHTLSPSKWNSASQRIKEFYLGEKGQFNRRNFIKLVQMFSDRHFLISAEASVRLQAKVNKSPVYYYTFGFPGDSNPDKVVNHGDSAQYIYGRIFKKEPFGKKELKMKDLLLDMVVSYAKTGKPTLGKANWKPTKYEELTYLSVDGVEPEEIQLKTTKELSPQAFWKSLEFLEGENLPHLRDEL